jgi:WD40 repeat protein
VQVWQPSGVRQHLYPALGIVDTVSWTPNATRLFVGSIGSGFHAITFSKNSVTHIGTQTAIRALAVSPDGHYLAVGGPNGAIALFDLQRAGKSTVYRLRKGTVLSLACGAMDNAAYVLEAATGRILHTLPHSGAVNGVAWDPTGVHRLATACEDSTVNIWEVDSNARSIYHGHTGAVLSVSWRLQGLASGSADATVIVWNV